jgi:hypothetical protein
MSEPEFPERDAIPSAGANTFCDAIKGPDVSRTGRDVQRTAEPYPVGSRSGTDSVPLSAIWALVQQWREETDPSDQWEDGYEAGHQDCAKQLAALCPAAPEEPEIPAL